MNERKEINGSFEKKSFRQKVSDAFIPQDVENVGLYILTDWIAPALWNFIQSGVNSMIKNPGGTPRINNQISNFGKPTRVVNPSPQFSYNNVYDQVNNNRSHYGELKEDPSTFMIPNRADAEMVLQEMIDLIGDEYGGEGKVSIGWFYDRCNVHPIPQAAWQWGWRDLRYARVERYNSGYRIVFPKPVNLK